MGSELSIEGLKPASSSGSIDRRGLEEEFDSADRQSMKYGELIIIGYNGSLPTHHRTCQQSKYILRKHDHPNGVKYSKHYVVTSPSKSKAFLDKRKYSIIFTKSKNQATIVEYQTDEQTDMFQVGRSTKTSNDFVVHNVIRGDFTPSQLSCRILVDRTYPHLARVYAAGFDSSKNIFLGEEATKWENSILICHPRGSYFGGEAKPGQWCEVSLGGRILSFHPSVLIKRKKIHSDMNVLQDGSLIDICGATLLWRSAESLKKSPTKEDLEKLVDNLNEKKPICPVEFTTLVFPKETSTGVNCYPNRKQQPYVYLNCGHVQGLNMWSLQTGSLSYMCLLCRSVGPVVKLRMGMEPAFYVDYGPPTFAFNPCGHMASEKTVKYWVNVPTPYGTNGLDAICPFCATPIVGSRGYVKLIFRNTVD
ncbi:protein pellino-like [Anabrus simplex]|uniref:protein pellino-like n=1 Tax=Anabrus simplex TaxID=316456 RepID=UPI0034DCE550